MMKILYFYLSGLLLLWSSCQRPTMLDFALRYAGENRVELEKVLDHYRNDSLKYRAAVFLIGNMPYHYFYTGAQLDSLRQGYRWMQRTGLSAKAVKHKLWKTFGEPDVRRWTKRNDARSVTADFLIRHIDYVFGVWEKRPWASYYSFEDFCEFVLPYRIEREPLEFWQEAYVRRYGRLCDSLCAVNPDVVFVASALNDHLRAEQNWYASSDLSFVEYGALQLLDERFGGCRELSGFNVALFRALGIPCGIDRVVQNPHRIGSHMWTFMVDTDGRKLPYLWNYYNIDREERMEEKYGKVYRDYFSVQTTNWAVSYPDEDIPGILKNPFLRDVSDEYFGRNVAVVP